MCAKPLRSEGKLRFRSAPIGLALLDAKHVPQMDPDFDASAVQPRFISYPTHALDMTQGKVRNYS
jgi:hypothetical protein